MFKKIWIVSIFSMLALFLMPCFGFATQAQAQAQEAEQTIEVNFFYGSGCPHCATEQKFLDEIEQKYSEIKINRYLSNDETGRELLKQLCQECDSERYLGLVPMTFVGLSDNFGKENKHEFFLGFDNAQGTGKQIEDSVQKQLKAIESNGTEQSPAEEQEQERELISLPILGQIDAQKYSLPVLAIILGALDGLNVCSLGSLVLILGLVLAFRSRRKIFIFGGLFILTTASVYALLMLLWYQVFELLSRYIGAMQVVVGLLAIAGGVFFFLQFLKFQKQGPVCKIGTENKIISKFTSRVEKVFENKKSIFTMIGAILCFAVLVTIIEFPCSAVVPVLYVGILSQQDLPTLQYLSYLALFIFFYMSNEIIVFTVSVLTMGLWLTSKKFITIATLFGAVIMTLLGVYYLSSFFM